MKHLPRTLLPLVMASGLALALTGCSTEHHDDPWLNPGQQERVGGKSERDAQTEQLLRDRARAGQAQR